MSTEIAKKAMLATLNISLIGMSEIDRKATADANRHFNTNNDAGKYQRCKIKPQNIKIIIMAAERARSVHKRLTRPWSDKYRMLPTALALEYTSKMNKARQGFEGAVRKIQAQWLNVVQLQEQRLRSMFNPKDYPGIDVDSTGKYTVRSNFDLSPYFTFQHELIPVPKGSHFVIDLAEEMINDLKVKLEKDNAKKMIESKNSLFKELLVPIKKVADICSNDKKVFETLIPSVEEIIDILPALNIENDAMIAAIVDETRTALTGYTVGQIRKDKGLKQSIGREAAHLGDKIEKIIGQNPN
jgi:hypothetical protein